jgi:hypothetical protein
VFERSDAMLGRLFLGQALLTSLLVVSCSGDNGVTTPGDAATATARYRVTFSANWSAATHPIDFPADPHFSRLVGATHGTAVSFWREGAPATAGVRDMAERGRTSPLDSEIRAAIAAGTADQLIVGGDIERSPGSVSAEFDAARNFPLVTLVSMVAPSPDWFVGVSGLALYENGAWVQERQVALPAWDAGTDSGDTFAAPDAMTTPPGLITRIVTPPLSPGGQVTPLGSFTFTRLR